MKNRDYRIIRSNSQTKAYEFLTIYGTFGPENLSKAFKTVEEAWRVADLYKKSNKNSAIKYTVVARIL